MASLERRLEALEGRMPTSENAERSEARERMRAALDEIAAARCEGRAPSPEAAAIMERMKAAIERRRARESA